MTREEVVLEAVAAAHGQVAGLQEIVLRVNRIMAREGERELSVLTIRNALQSMIAAPKPLIQMKGTDLPTWGLTRDGKKKAKK